MNICMYIYTKIYMDKQYFNAVCDEKFDVDVKVVNDTVTQFSGGKKSKMILIK